MTLIKQPAHTRRWHHFARLAAIYLLFGLKSAMAIVNGTPANWNQYPWLAMNVAMNPDPTKWQNRGCSSMIIDQYWAVTAGHCLKGPYSYPVGLMFSDGTVIQVVQEIRNPNYSYDPLAYKYPYGVVSSSVADIGLQRLAQPIGYAKGRQVFDIFANIIFAELQPNLNGVTGKVLGWGSTQLAQAFFPAPGTFSPTLQQMNETVQPSASCQAVLNEDVEFLSDGAVTQSPFQFNSSLFCASPLGYTPTLQLNQTLGPGGVCTGDSGPLFIDILNQPVVLGFVTDQLYLSVQQPCGNSVDIYTKLTPAYVQWMASVITGHQ